jgi:ABC-2 type transport system permease protein
MRTLKFLLQKEFRQIFRNKTILRMIIAVPIIQLLILPLAADYEVKKINISLVDHDHSAYSRRLADRILSSGYFRANDYSADFGRSLQEFQKDRSDLVLEIPAHFESDLVTRGEAGLFIAVNAINGVKASVGASYLSRIITAFNSDVRMEWISPPRFNPAPLIEVVPLNRFNPHLRYPFFMVPGILVILVTLIGINMCAMNIVKEKEVGTPIRKHHFILGKLIPFWIIGMFVFSLGLFGVARIVYGIVPEGSLLLLYGFLAIYMVALLGMGLLISTYCSTQQQSMSVAFFCMMIFILMSGLFTSVDAMPAWAQWIAKANPVTYFIDVMRMVVLKGSGFSDVKGHLIAVSVMAVFFNSWAIWNYRKTT